ncbi:HAD family hydrolase [Cytobacillus gottheilii]|uniref:HAD family hydrolase n=1 Tax=Cytobacillus gottheilii TaxID=859144 RepID=UPI0009BAA927|nr:HAD hydrolase-like protein [Cytobacillus gottheilii]
MLDYKAYIFDLDDTLYCEHEYVKSGFKAVAEEIASQSNYSINDVYPQLLAMWKESGRGKIFDDVCKMMNIELDIAHLVDVYRSNKPIISLYEDAQVFLNFLKEERVKAALITDGNSLMQWSKIKALNLEGRFDCIVVTGDLGSDFWKPHELPYKKVVECLNMSYEQCVYIGDNPNKDFITASKLGMGTVRIIRDVGDHMKLTLSKEYEADRNIYSLLELIDK